MAGTDAEQLIFRRKDLQNSCVDLILTTRNAGSYNCIDINHTGDCIIYYSKLGSGKICNIKTDARFMDRGCFYVFFCHEYKKILVFQYLVCYNNT